MVPWRKIRRGSFAILLVIFFGSFLFIELNLQLRPIKRIESQQTSGILSGLLTFQKIQINGNINNGKKLSLSRRRGLEKRILRAELALALSKTLKQPTDYLQFSPSIPQKVTRISKLSNSVTPTTNSHSKTTDKDRSKILFADYGSKTMQNRFLGEDDHTRKTNLQDIFLSVKTTNQFHKTRVVELLQTWVDLAKNQVYFFTDVYDSKSAALGVNLISTSCPAGHHRFALCCKMSSELNYYLENSMSRWFCHFDDDNYVNVPTLINTLRKYNHTDDVYLGKVSVSRKMEVYDRKDSKPVKFWFATGGAGFCLSKSLIQKMVPYVRGNRFMNSCDRIGVPDDCTIGFISERLLGVKLTELKLFHSHLENLHSIGLHEFSEQITFSHGIVGGTYNRVHISSPFTLNEDPSRFKSLHCFLFPKTSWCPKRPSSLHDNIEVPHKGVGRLKEISFSKIKGKHIDKFVMLE